METEREGPSESERRVFGWALLIVGVLVLVYSAGAAMRWLPEIARRPEFFPRVVVGLVMIVAGIRKLESRGPRRRWVGVGYQPIEREKTGERPLARWQTVGQIVVFTLFVGFCAFSVLTPGVDLLWLLALPLVYIAIVVRDWNKPPKEL